MKKALKRKIEGQFEAVPGGYSRRISNNTVQFVPFCSAADFNLETGELYGYAPDYDAIEAAKTPAMNAEKPGVYSYCYETQQAPTGCDFSADLAFYGRHYFLRPLHNDLPILKGRGITYDEANGVYMVTLKAFDKLKVQYKIMRETCLD